MGINGEVVASAEKAKFLSEPMSLVVGTIIFGWTFYVLINAAKVAVT
jgi:hypothetical protein